MVNCSYSRLQDQRLWNNRSLGRFRARMFSCTQRVGLSRQQDSSDRNSYGGANSHKSWVDQGDRWVIKFRLGLNLFDLIKL